MNRQQLFDSIVEATRTVDTKIDHKLFRFDDTPFRQYGVESLTLIRLARQIEKDFGVAFTDADTFDAYSFRRLVDLVAAKMDAAGDDGNLLAAIESKAAQVGDRGHLRLMGADDDEVITYDRLLRMSRWLGSRFPSGNDGPPQTVVIAATDPFPTLIAFFAALGIGAKPLIVPPPKALGGKAAFQQRLEQTLGRFASRRLLAIEKGMLPDEYLPRGIPRLDLSRLPADYDAIEHLPAASPRLGRGDEVAFLQMTSASTGTAKLVAISHRNVLDNLRAVADSMAMGDDERCISWLPLYHDMGLVGATLLPILFGHPLALLTPSGFIRDPARWIRGISDLGSTLTGSPTFGFEYAARAVSDGDLAGVDLSTLRHVAVAAEPIRLPALRTFVDRFGPYGFRATSFVPGLGLAESTLGTTTSSGSEPRYLLVEPRSTAVGEPVRVLGEGRLQADPKPAGGGDTGDDTGAGAGAGRAGGDGTGGVPVFSLGTPVAGLDVHLRLDDGGTVQDECVLGEVIVRGSSVAAGYFDPAVDRAIPFPDGVLHTGDLGFFQAGDLFVLERKKNVIIRNGQNFLASLFEERVAEILGVSSSGVIVVDADVLDPTSEVHVIVESYSGTGDLRPDQEADLRGLDLPADVISFARRSVIPRTSSGKKRYHVCRQQLADGALRLDRTLRLRGVH